MAMSSIILALLLLPFSFNPSQDTTTLSQRYEAVQELVRSGKFPEAEREYKAILAEQYRKLRRIYTALNDRERAIEAGEAAANYQPDNSDLLIELATLYLEAAQFDKALAPLSKAVQLKPDAEVQKLLGKTYFAAGDYEKSAAALTLAVTIDPNDFNTTFTLAIAYLQQRQFPSARRVFDRMIAQFGEHPQMRVAIGRAFREAGRLPEAIEEFKKAISLNSNLPGTAFRVWFVREATSQSYRLN
jgi:tetratricopeptide (TPR) repeat protein